MFLRLFARVGILGMVIATGCGSSGASTSASTSSAASSSSSSGAGGASSSSTSSGSGGAKSLAVLFDSMGNQVQVDDETMGQRLKDMYAAVTALPAVVSKTDYKKPISEQLTGVSVLVILTHQYSDAPGTTPAIPASYPFAYPQADLDGIPAWVQGGGGLLLVTNHGGQNDAGDHWDLNDIPLAQKFGITIVPAFFVAPTAGATLTLTPASTAPPALVQGVTSVVAWDSGGITGTSPGVSLFAIPSTAVDVSGMNTPTSPYSFGWYQPFGKGRVVVLGHAGIAGNDDTTFPSPGQFDAANDKALLLNCIKYLGSG